MNIFLIECSGPHWLKVARTLEVAGHQIQLWTGLRTLKMAVRETTRDCVFHDTALAKKGLDPLGNVPVTGNFDEACQSVWTESAQSVYDQMNRFDFSRDWSFNDRSLVFFRILLQWREVLRFQDPDLIIFPAPPHVVYDFILLELATRLGIQTVMFQTAMPILSTHSLVQKNYDQPFLRVSQSPTRPVRKEIENLIEQAVRRLQSDYGVAQPKTELAHQKAKQKSLRTGVTSLVVSLGGVLLFELFGRRVSEVNYGPLVKEKGKTLEQSYVSRFSGSKYYLQRIREWRYNRQLEKTYESNASWSKDAPAIYVALNRQPERTSNPQAGIFTNQVLMVHLLSKHLPAGWKIWVRDHPTQFQPGWVVNPYRSRAYYESMLSMPGVELVPMTLDPFDLIDSSVIVATLGGTVAIEAVARGKPVLLFGEPWFKGLKGMFSVRNDADLREAMESFPKWADARPGHVVELLKQVVDMGFEGVADIPQDEFPLSQEENANNLADVILKFVETNLDTREQGLPG